MPEMTFPFCISAGHKELSCREDEHFESSTYNQRDIKTGCSFQRGGKERPFSFGTVNSPLGTSQIRSEKSHRQVVIIPSEMKLVEVQMLAMMCLRKTLPERVSV